jgi:hypothetical protein
MVAVMIGVDPHKGSHTAVAISPAEEPLGELRVRASAGHAERLLAWAQAWPERTWAIEGAAGLGHLLAQQLLAAGERVLDVQPKLGARVRLLATGAVHKNDPNDARSVAVAAGPAASTRSAGPANDSCATASLARADDTANARDRASPAPASHTVLFPIPAPRTPPAPAPPGGCQKPIHRAQLGRPPQRDQPKRRPDARVLPHSPILVRRPAPGQPDRRHRPPAAGHDALPGRPARSGPAPHRPVKRPGQSTPPSAELTRAARRFIRRC